MTKKLPTANIGWEPETDYCDEFKMKRKVLSGNEHEPAEFFPCESCLTQKRFQGCAIPCNRKELMSK